ncbi:MAG: DUF4174 domain-containing protein [Cyanobacteria bacterium P01_G01_bin.49]
MSKQLVVLILLAMISFSSAFGYHQFQAIAQNNPLAPYRWQNRLLLVFIPKVSDSRLATIEQTITEVECEFQDRDLLLGVFATDAPSFIGTEKIAAYDVAALRAKYGIKSHEFALILVGKDGQPKSQLSSVPEIEQIFGRIDTMPMRQQEMANRPNACDS